MVVAFLASIDKDLLNEKSLLRFSVLEYQCSTYQATHAFIGLRLAIQPAFSFSISTTIASLSCTCQVKIYRKFR
jgi:hypothetical protein